MLTWSTLGLTPSTSSLPRLCRRCPPSPPPMTVLLLAAAMRPGSLRSGIRAPDWRAAKSGWRRRTPWLIREILKNTQFSYTVANRNGNSVLWGVHLELKLTGRLMLHLECLNQVAQLVYFGRWSLQNTMLRTTLLWQDGGRGYDIVMTTSLSSDVPVGYFSWAEYDIMAPVQPKTQKALAAAFISNCGARNFRLQALEALEKESISIDSYGSCHRNKDGRVDKVDTLRQYKFSLAFENSNEEDYVTEKFSQSLVAALWASLQTCGKYGG
ncbi:alpha-(1,3)-fucosyltransferase fut-6-like isoform X2 [Ipomoea triloba]|uniref:alpha-(1,3)-fucosyltransferase fut-6-like isoform X2 n=1 Tax=Ipomoea triloba TaxID=35885 RepID=UPI00125CEC0C|nr:alpha-(1,3)-fucosyltransferase fut-6-like isoform X2 [Ipomoea triloba]XP_031126317.1 alpha-(1,3)-fucosyltransferase fut-6-like isoform X2 [Ipomoea triloba]